VSGKSVLSRRASSLVEPELPLRAYFLSVGGALLLVLFAAHWVLPAPLPSRHAASQSVPPIRIRSDVKGPQAVVIDTSRVPSTAMLADNDGVTRPSQPPGLDAAETAAESTAPSTETPFRESMAQLQPAISDEADRKPREAQAPMRKLAPARPGLRRRTARHRSLETRLGNCAAFGREHDPCRYALAPNW
jgi:hypothetical protein